MKRLLLLMSAAALFSACDKDCDEPVYNDNQISVSALMEGMTPGTKVTDDGTNASWETNDVIGLFCAQSNPAAANAQFTYSGSTWSAGTPVYWKDYSTLHKFYAYAPYASGNTVTAVAVPLLNSQNGTITSAQNLLYSNNLDAGIAKTSNGGNASLTFKHALSLIQLNIVTDNSVPSGTKLSSAVISGGASDAVTTSGAGATLNVQTGVITGNSATSNSITVQPASPVTLSSTPITLNVLLLPVTSSLTLVVNTAFSDSSTGSAQISMGASSTFAQFTKYTYTVTVSRNAITITGMSISPWTSGGSPIPINPVL